MKFYAFGVNHLQAPVEVREAFALGEEGTRALHRSTELTPGSELILLSTCNRTEAYLYGSSADVETVTRALCSVAERRWPDDMAFSVQDEDAVRHILEVAAGLKSLILGDGQIFSQLKEAYRIAVEEERVGTTMHRLMHTAFRLAKRIVNETDLSTGAASVPYVAVDAARRSMESADDRPVRDMRALVVGCGKMARLSLEALRQSGSSRLALTNRSEERGREVAARADAEFVMWSERHASAIQHDVVIVATSAEAPVLVAADLPEAEAHRTTFVDISIPRNVDPKIADIGYTVIGLDELNVWLSETESIRRTAVPQAQRIVLEMLGEFVSWVFHHQALQPVIQTIADTFETIRANEVERHHQRLSDFDRDELDRLTQSIIQKILAVPVVRLKGVEPESIDFVRGIRLLHALFRRGECEENNPHDAASAIQQDGNIAGDLRREDCPIDQQIPRERFVERISDLELDDVLRLFSRNEADGEAATTSGDEHGRS